MFLAPILQSFRKLCASPDPQTGVVIRFPARRWKLLGAVLILLGLVLPLYSCRGQFVDAGGKEVKFVDQRGAVVSGEGLDPRLSLPPGVIRLEPGMKPPTGVRYQKSYRYFFSNFSADDVVDWCRLGGFLWPMAAAVFAGRLRRRWSRRLFRCLEPLLVLETTFSLAIGAMFGTKEIGFWTAWSGVILYSLGAAWDDLVALSAWKPELGRVGRSLAAILFFGTFLASSVLSVMVFFKWFVK